jgi:regulator of sigma E protease
LARACGIRVDAFAIGFGPKIVSRTVGETTYSLNLIPFGGYVKIFGENPDNESLNGKDKDRSFISRPKLEQIAVLIAGIMFNFIFAAFLFFITFTLGAPTPLDGYPAYKDRLENPRIAITYVNTGSPAYRAGLKAGDTLIVESVEVLQKTINESKTNGVVIEFVRGGVASTTKIFAEQGIVDGRYAIGISMDNIATLKLPLHLAVIEGVRFTVHSITRTITEIYGLVAGIFDGTSSSASIAGPVGIAGMVGERAKLGISHLLMFTAMISINLGVINLVPFPALDGGRILFVIIEAIIRRPIKPVIANVLNTIGFGLLIILMIFVTFKDIAKLFVK